MVLVNVVDSATIDLLRGLIQFIESQNSRQKVIACGVLVPTLDKLDHQLSNGYIQLRYPC
jgi:hypothetical protein